MARRGGGQAGTKYELTVGHRAESVECVPASGVQAQAVGRYWATTRRVRTPKHEGHGHRQGAQLVT